jgi:pimeloyl-ACP methyl ester carboxylesterase
MKREIFKLNDGRDLEFLSNGITSPQIIFLHAGTSQDISGWKSWLDYFAEKNIAAIAIGRSGYVNSSPKPGRITFDIANDISQLAEHLGIQKMVNIGLSGGGQHALATGLDSRSVGVVTLGSLAPFAEMGDDFYTGMQPEDLAEYADAFADINLLIERFKKNLFQNPESAIVGNDLTKKHRKAQSTQSFKNLIESCSYTMSAGWDWVADDYSSYLKPWGFDPRAIKVPVEIWQGGLDVNVPVQHGKWLATHIKSANLNLIPDESHIGLYVNYEVPAMESAIKLLNA